jgi:circadian clock protein KaiC
VSGVHFFVIDSDGVSFYPRVRAPALDGDMAVDTPEPVVTGIPGLDPLLGRGLPRASATVVQGATGTGKTLLGLRFLVEGARRGEKGILFTLDESPGQLRGIARGLGIDLGELERQGRLVLSYTSPVELSTDRFLNDARRLVRETGATRAVFDDLTSIALGVVSERRFKELVYALTRHFRAAGVTLVMTMEIPELLGSAAIGGQGVSFAADNLVRLRYVELAGRLERALCVIKMRGVKHANTLHLVSIGRDGFEVGAPFSDARGALSGSASSPGKPGT